MLKVQNTRLVTVGSWDSLVEETYGKPYNFQQQDGCKERGMHHITIPFPCEDMYEDVKPDKIDLKLEGVSFEVWNSIPVEQFEAFRGTDRSHDLFWGRNFYPDVQMVANDLHAKGLIEAGEYAIEIDW